MNRLRGKTAEIRDGKAGAGEYIAGCVVSVRNPVITVYIDRFNFKNSTFCPHSVFMCFVWI